MKTLYTTSDLPGRASSANQPVSQVSVQYNLKDYKTFIHWRENKPQHIPNTVQ